MNSTNFYGFLYEKTFNNIFAISLTNLAAFVSAIMSLVIIWYERYGTDHKACLSNKIICMVCWTTVFALVIIQTIDTIMFFQGPMSEGTCLVYTYIRSVFRTNILNFMNAFTVHDCIMVVWLKNPENIQHEFWSQFVSLWVHGLSILTNFVQFYLPQKQGGRFYICCNKIASKDNDLPENILWIVEIVTTLTIHLLCFIAIKMQKKTQEQPNPVGVNPRRRTLGISKHMQLNFLKSQTISDIPGHLIIILWMVLYLFSYEKFQKVSIAEMGKFPYDLFCMLFVYCFACFTCSIVVFVYYLRHPPLRKAAKDGMLEWYNKFSSNLPF